jgi:hypothetical protein
MPKAIDTRHAGLAAASKRVKKSTAVTSVGASGLYTVAARWLNDLTPNDVVTFSGLTGGSGITAGVDYHLAGPRIEAVRQQLKDVPHVGQAINTLVADGVLNRLGDLLGGSRAAIRTDQLTI